MDPTDKIRSIIRQSGGGRPPDLGQVTMAPRDRFGVPMRTGMNVVYRPEFDMVFKIVGGRPILDPRMPPGFMELDITCSAKIMVQVAQPNGRMICLGVEDAPPADPPKEGDTQTPPADAPVDPPPPAGDTPLVSLT